ncbi:DUF5958 family protein [Streptomyces sp. NPDC001292]|uniref:DUF5958 family protein n=1 Tax=Streptomyces sp. NPDC001292 TaxID=3364558 RepID=UPI00367F1B28
MAQGVEWFAGLAAVEQRSALRELAQFCTQAHAAAEDANDAIACFRTRPDLHTGWSTSTSPQRRRTPATGAAFVTCRSHRHR